MKHVLMSSKNKYRKLNKTAILSLSILKSNVLLFLHTILFDEYILLFNTPLLIVYYLINLLITQILLVIQIKSKINLQIDPPIVDNTFIFINHTYKVIPHIDLYFSPKTIYTSLLITLDYLLSTNLLCEYSFFLLCCTNTSNHFTILCIHHLSVFYRFLIILFLDHTFYFHNLTIFPAFNIFIFFHSTYLMLNLIVLSFLLLFYSLLLYLFYLQTTSNTHYFLSPSLLNYD